MLTKGGDTKTFLKEFGITAATCLLKWVVRNNITGESKIVSKSGKVPVGSGYSYFIFVVRNIVIKPCNYCTRWSKLKNKTNKNANQN